MEMRDYFRLEATELIGRMSADVRALQGGAENADHHWHELARAAHTFKGAAHVVREAAMARSAHEVEDALALRDPRKVQRLVDALAEMLEAAFALPVPVVAAQEQEKQPQPQAETFRVDLDATNELYAAISQMHVVLSSGRELPDALLGAREHLARSVRLAGEGRTAQAIDLLLAVEVSLRKFSTDLAGRQHALQTALQDVERCAGALRLASAEAMLLRIERIVRRTAEEAGLAADCVLLGGDERVDAHLLAEAEEALAHMARNAVVHGRGSRIEVGLQQQNGLVDFYCKDDGSGIDVEDLRRKAIANGWMSIEAARSASHARLLDLLSQRGVTTRLSADLTSGRGVGLDIVRNVARRLHGTMQIESALGRGTTVHLRVPQQVFALPALVLRLGADEFAIPLRAVEKTVRASNAEALAEELQGIPLLNPAVLIGSQKSTETRVATILRSGEHLFAVPADAIVRMDELVTQSMPEEWHSQPWIGGLYRDDAGEPRLLLDPTGLHALGDAEMLTHAPRRSPAKLLVIDDSLTSRTLEENILTSAGYVVDTAIHAEDGLAAARRRAYDLILVDVEMPGMDGFAFVTTTRNEPELRQIPIIMVTSRNRPGDRERGLALGASDYIVKGDFDQGVLLATVARLTAGLE